ncbi:adenylate/guanylate cyclase domain-containing protein [Cryptosporangium aurantiacum]|uniref:Tetratricopeptide repeat-containing protein n=1 Tax=Cryptosporangium aurantiacum TaxID=134849 RepID=A0A1M7NJS2_9ACTN|nr:adenylate/guanylate cyclase domain-containing protein [Cryptosporangium aurantiacum]SHN03687.1 Tetratricopeptide repeat-containing protein [Cryptosporangium aurantiacum]
MTCPVCGTVAVPGARYCHHCGTRLPDVEPAAFATERRVVTVLFGDLTDFTAWSEDLDPERVGRLTDRVLAACAQAVTAFGGHVDKLTGDGIMAVFGAPVAHEDDPERAVRSALAMQRAVKRVIEDELGGGRRLGLRVGVNTGEVVAGVQAALSYTVIGDTVNTAARLSDAAGMGAVYAGARTQRATRDRAAWRRLPPLRLKGKRQPVEAYELLGLRDAPGIRPGLGDEAPFVGREVETGRLLGRFAEVVDEGEPRVVVVTAEAGAGKTRLGAEVARMVGDSYGARTLSTRCPAFGETGRLAPLADLVRQACGVEPDERGDRIAERIRRVATDLPDPGLGPGGVEVLFDLVGVESDVDALSGVPGISTAAGRRERTPAVLAALLTGLAATDPVLVELDDVHNASPDTLDAIGGLVDRLDGAVLLLLLGRPELVRTHGLLTRLAAAEPLPLPPLTGAAVSRLLRSYLGGPLDRADETRLLATAQGNPFYLAELVSLLVEQGRLTGGAGGWRLAPGGFAGRLLSSDLAAVLTARIDALPPYPRTVLRDAAVVGDRVPAGALEELRGSRRSLATAASDLDRALADLISRRMLRRTASGGYGFVTALMREAAYSGIGHADLAARHARIARWADGEPVRGLSDVERDEFIARHAERALRLADQMSLPPQHQARQVAGIGVAALHRLSERTIALGEPARALGLLDRAIALLPERAQGTVGVDDLRLLRARALLASGRADEAREIASAVAVGDGPVAVAALLVKGEALRAVGETRAAVAAWSSALRRSRAAGLPHCESEALRRLGMLDYLSGRLPLAERRFTAAYRVASASDDGPGTAWALQHLAWSATTRGDFDRADRVLEEARAVFARLDDPAGRSWVRGTTAFVRLLEGRLHEARRLAEKFVPYAERVADGWAVAALRIVDAFAAAELGDLTHATDQADLAHAAFVAGHDPWGASLALTVRGVIARGLDRLDEAVELLTEALEVGAQISHPLTAGIALTVRGYCHLGSGEVAAAEADAVRTLELIAPLEVDPSTRVGPLVLQAQARRLSGDRDGAIKLFGEVVNDASGPSLLFPRRQALAHYAGVLLEAGRAQESLEWARRASRVPAEDIRSRIVSRRALAVSLAASGALPEALVAADEAVALAYGTEQASERAASDTVRDRVALAHALARPE